MPRATGILTLLFLAVLAAASSLVRAQEARPVQAGIPARAEDPRADQAGVLDPGLLKMSSRRLVDGLQRPVDIAHAGDGSGRLFIVEKPGRIRIVEDGQLLPRPFLDITDRVNAGGNEQGLLGLAFHPRYAENGIFFVNYSTSSNRGGTQSGDTVVSRFNTTGRPDQGDPNSERVILTIAQPFANHNGGDLAFGPDGFLWIGTGDGGSGGDPQGNGQKLSTLLGKFLRIDIDTGDANRPYNIPFDNPFVGRDGARPEIWSYGWRNPWRFTFDRRTGDLWAGDVGQNAWEEVDHEPRGTAGGRNYGWNTMEGTHCFRPAQNCDSSGMTLPVAEYGRGLGVSITGGEVYRGKANPQLDGLYFYADYGSKRLWALGPAPAGAGTGPWRTAQVATLSGNPTSFGSDEEGELYVAFDGGAVHRLEVADISPAPTLDPGTPAPEPTATGQAGTAPPPSATATGQAGTPPPPTPEIRDTPSATPELRETATAGAGRWWVRLPWLGRGVSGW